MQALARAVGCGIVSRATRGHRHQRPNARRNQYGVGSVPGGALSYATVLPMIETVEAANAMLTPGGGGVCHAGERGEVGTHDRTINGRWNDARAQ